MDLSQKRIDLDKQKNGVWYQLDKDTRLLVGRVASPYYKEVLRQNFLPYQAEVRAGTLPEKTRDEITVKTLAEVVLLNWEGLTENGEVVPYSREKAEAILGDPSLEWFREQVEIFGSTVDNYFQASVENLKK